MLKRAMCLVAASALFLAGCGDDDGDDASTGETTATTEASEQTTTTTEAGEDLTLEEWVEQADEICAEADEAAGEVEEPAEDDPEAMAEGLTEIRDIFEQQIDDIEALGAPEDEAELIEEALEILRTRIDFLQEAIDAAEDGDLETVGEVLGQDPPDEERLDEITEELGLQECGGGGDDEPDEPDEPVEPSGDEPMSYGDDEELDALWDDCEAGDADACEDLFWQSPIDSEYEDFGQACGNALDEGESDCEGLDVEREGEPGAGEPMSYGDDEELDALYDACESGDGEACDDLYWGSPIDSEYEDFGRTCGDLYTDEDAPFSCADAMS